MMTTTDVRVPTTVRHTSQQVVVVSKQSQLNGLLETVLDAETKDIPLVTCTSPQDDEETPDESLDPREGVFSQPAAMQLN